MRRRCYQLFRRVCQIVKREQGMLVRQLMAWQGPCVYYVIPRYLRKRLLNIRGRASGGQQRSGQGSPAKTSTKAPAECSVRYGVWSTNLGTYLVCTEYKSAVELEPPLFLHHTRTTTQ